MERDLISRHVSYECMLEETENLRGLTFLTASLLTCTSGQNGLQLGCGGEAGPPVAVVALPAARRAGLEE
jgi:hypothetical protein